ncbi:MAG: hypothetical protein WD059_04660 [Balneolaceae bacterium]
MESIQVIKEIINIVAPILGLVIAAIGVFTWRIQLKGKTEYELSRRLLKAVYELRDAIKVVRNPAIIPEEVVSAFRKKGLSDEEIIKKGDIVFSKDVVYEYRWKYITTALSTLEVEELEAEVLWGKEIKEEIHRFKQCTYKLNLNLKRLFRQEVGKRNFSKEKLDEIHKVVWDDFENDTPFDIELSSTLKDIEEFLKPHLKL